MLPGKYKQKLLIAMGFVLCIMLQRCGKRDFFPDPNNPGLSLLTSRGYNIMSAYINNVPYANTFKITVVGDTENSQVLIRKIHTNAPQDTLVITWNIEYSDSSDSVIPQYNYLNVLIPVAKDFTQADFLAWNGTRFTPDSATGVTMELASIFDPVPVSGGTAGIYFVQIARPTGDNSGDYYFSGIFEGQIGNNISIKKGRFDFIIYPSQIGF